MAGPAAQSTLRAGAGIATRRAALVAATKMGIGGVKWATQGEVIDAISNGRACFHRSASTVRRIIRYDSLAQYLFEDSDSLQYLNRTVVHHEQLHEGQYLRHSRIVDYGGTERIYEVLPVYMGTQEIYGVLSLMIVTGIYLKWKLNE
jgi:hypothetical protein